MTKQRPQDSQAFGVPRPASDGGVRFAHQLGPSGRRARFRTLGRAFCLALLLAAPSIAALGCGGDDITVPGNVPIRPTRPPATETPDDGS